MTDTVPLTNLTIIEADNLATPNRYPFFRKRGFRAFWVHSTHGVSGLNFIVVEAD